MKGYYQHKNDVCIYCGSKLEYVIHRTIREIDVRQSQSSYLYAPQFCGDKAFRVSNCKHDVEKKYIKGCWDCLEKSFKYEFSPKSTYSNKLRIDKSITVRARSYFGKPSTNVKNKIIKVT